MDLLHDQVNEVEKTVSHLENRFSLSAVPEQVGSVTAAGRDVAWSEGLMAVRSEELLRVGSSLAMALEVLPDTVGMVLLDSGPDVVSRARVTRTKRVLDVPVGETLLGRIVDPLGRPLDGGPPLSPEGRWPVQRDAPAILDRAAVNTPLQTGYKVVDALFPIGRGQRELILGDRKTGKSALALDAIINQRGKDVVCFYCAIGQRSSSVAKAIEALKSHGALEYSVVVVVEGEAPAGLQYVAPYAATTMAEFFMERGRDVLIVYDDLTSHARAYRQLSLLLRRPPGREAYPGDIFYIHSRLLERSTHLKKELGGGSLTALPIIETEAQNISAYIPTNLISITDGQLYLSPELFQKGLMPAVDVGLSVSRVGGKAQIPAYREVAGDLRLSYTQFQELESFSRFGTRLDEETRKKLRRGNTVRQVFRQKEHDLLSAVEQIIILYAANLGLLDQVKEERLDEVQKELVRAVRSAAPELEERLLLAGRGDDIWQQLEDVLLSAGEKSGVEPDGDAAGSGQKDTDGE